MGSQAFTMQRACEGTFCTGLAPGMLWACCFCGWLGLVPWLRSRRLRPGASIVYRLAPEASLADADNTITATAILQHQLYRFRAGRTGVDRDAGWQVAARRPEAPPRSSISESSNSESMESNEDEDEEGAHILIPRRDTSGEDANPNAELAPEHLRFPHLFRDDSIDSIDPIRRVDSPGVHRIDDSEGGASHAQPAPAQASSDSEMSEIAAQRAVSMAELMQPNWADVKDEDRAGYIMGSDALGKGSSRLLQA